MKSSKIMLNKNDFMMLLMLLSTAFCWMSTKDKKHYREKARQMFYHGYDSYLKYAYPYDELKPLSCSGQDTWGSYSLTLIDALDTLLIMGNKTEFKRVAKLLEDTISFERDINVSVFETNIRGDNRFINAATDALEALWKKRSKIGLVGNHINVQTGEWTAVDSGIGAGVDSYFEYLVKGSTLFSNPRFMEMFQELSATIKKRLKYNDWYLWVNMDSGKVTLPIFQSLEAYWPGVQVLAGNIGEASRTFYNYYQIWRQYGATPEFYELSTSKAYAKREGYPLRPELIESALYLYQATSDPFFLDVGRDIIESIELLSKQPCGYATIKDVNTHELEDRMESFFLAETTKYLYLLFDEDNFIHKYSDEHFKAESIHNDCFLGSSGYIFNTEAHPIDLAGIHCCKHKHVNSTYLLNALSRKFACKRRPFHQKMFGLGTYVEDDSNLFHNYPDVAS
ncbi:ER degradation-enhancing alpha-mannosidase-like protein 2 isoform X2 [Hydra vulgaris]|uniref:ER degradation-enhancing alpha-mannosidase-like protein 2 isoform X2 n=1 Tax=Hydra vulgaris TaxID=6087 RepID=UPI001F5E37F3|nr:ER degradation-enhancing alpha-mannosidase-like protein 2 isoform X2 [Hydra vulgaris]